MKRQWIGLLLLFWIMVLQKTVTSVIRERAPIIEQSWKGKEWLTIPFPVLNETKEHYAWVAASFLEDRYFQVTTNNDIYLVESSGKKKNMKEASVLHDQHIIKIATQATRTVFLSDTGRVYGMGNNEYGAFGIGTDRTPIQLQELHLRGAMENKVVKDVQTGATHHLYTGQDGVVYASGSSHNGQIPSTPSLKVTNTTVKLDLPNTIVKSVAQARFNYFLDVTGMLYVSGDNSGGQLGIGSMDNSNVVVQIQLNGTIAQDVFLGNNFAFVLDTQGHVYAVGDNSFGQLGLGTLPRTLTPKRLHGPWNGSIVAVATGPAQTLFLDDTNTFYGCGFNLQGELGGILYRVLQPQIISFYDNPTNISQFVVGKQYSLFLDSKKEDMYVLGSVHGYQIRSPFKLQEQIVELATPKVSRDHLLMLDTKGVVYAYGNGGMGNLGVGRQHLIVVPPMRVKFDPGTVIRKIATGVSHSLFLNDIGHVYGCGLNTNGQLGLGHVEHHVYIPQRVFVNESIVVIEAGETHSIFFSPEGRGYVSGKINFDELGRVFGAFTTLPRRMNISTLIEGRGLIQVSSGYSHTLFLDTEGIAYSVGMNTHGQLGTGNVDRQYTPTEVYRKDHLFNKEIVQVAASHLLSYFLDRHGNVYTCGNHITSSQYDFKQILYPVKVQFNGTVLVQKMVTNTFAIMYLTTEGDVYMGGFRTNTFYEKPQRVESMSNCRDVGISLQSTFGLCFSEESQANPLIRCPSGQLISSQRCVPCPKGYACPDDLTNTPCEEGSYSYGEKSHSCYACPKGTYTILRERRRPSDCSICFKGSYTLSSKLPCEPCSLGHYCPFIRMQQPIPCPEGKFSPIFGSVTNATCKSCAKGHLCPPGTDTQPSTPCEDGMYVNYALSLDSCSPCEAGYACENGIRHRCPNGTYSGPLASTCSPCPSGMFCLEGSTPDTLLHCEQGYFCPAGSHQMIDHPCEPGTYSAMNGSSTCLLCPSETYSPQWASITCEPCEACSGDGSFLPFSLSHHFGIYDASNESQNTNTVIRPDESKMRDMYMAIFGGVWALFLFFLVIVLVLLWLCDTCKGPSWIQHVIFPRLDRFSLKHLVHLSQPMIKRQTSLGGMLSLVSYVASLGIFNLLLVMFLVNNVQQSVLFHPISSDDSKDLSANVFANMSLIRPSNANVSSTSPLLVDGFSKAPLVSTQSLDVSKHFQYDFLQTSFFTLSPTLRFSFDSNVPLSAISFQLAFESLVNSSSQYQSTLQFLYLTRPSHHFCGHTRVRVGVDFHQYFRLPYLQEFSSYIPSLFSFYTPIEYRYYQLKFDQVEESSCPYTSSPSGYPFSIDLLFDFRTTKIVTTERFMTSLISLISFLFSAIGVMTTVISLVLWSIESSQSKIAKRFRKKKEPLAADDLVSPFLPSSTSFELDDVPDDPLNVLSFRVAQLQQEIEALSQSTSMTT